MENLIEISFQGELLDTEREVLDNLKAEFAVSRMISGEQLIDIFIMASPVAFKYIKDIVVARIEQNKLRKFKYKDIEITGMNPRRILDLLKELEKGDETKEAE